MLSCTGSFQVGNYRTSPTLSRVVGEVGGNNNLWNISIMT